MDTSVRIELDRLAMALEEKGHKKLGQAIDQINEEIHTRKASVVRRPARKASPVGLTKKEVVGGMLRDVRFARAEFRALAREFKASGSIRDAREMLRLAADLADDEQDLAGQYEGDVVDVDVAVDGADLDIAVEPEGDEECVCTCDHDDGDGDEDDTASDDADVDADEVVEARTSSYRPGSARLSARAARAEYIACVSEIRAVARELRASSDIEDRRKSRELLIAARDIEEEHLDGDAEVEAPVDADLDGGAEAADGGAESELEEDEHVDAPTTDLPIEEMLEGVEPPLDASDFSISDDDLIDFALENDESLDEVEDLAVDGAEGESDEGAESSEDDGAGEEAEEEVSPSEYMATAATLLRTSEKLRAAGYKKEATKLAASAARMRSAATRKR